MTTETKLALHADLQTALANYRAACNFNAEAWIGAKCTKFNDYMRRCGLKAAIVSLSGGVDSAVMLGLMKRAMEMPGSPITRIAAVNQPIHSSSWAFNRAKECADAMGVQMFTVDQTSIYDQLRSLVDGVTEVKSGDFASGQLRSYMRTPVGYYVAQLLSQAGTPCVVMGTGNRDEDGYLLYFCKAGDGVVDIQLIADLHKSQVFTVGRAVGVVDSILSAAPSADLWAGQTDEEELGFSYDFVELFTGYFLPLTQTEQESFLSGLSQPARTQFEESAAKARAVHARNSHKAGGPVNL